MPSEVKRLWRKAQGLSVDCGCFQGFLYTLKILSKNDKSPISDPFHEENYENVNQQH